jgi:hypothetical protein
MRFTRTQYETAIENLQDAMTQLQPDGRDCAICGDTGHQAFECGHNPLLAMQLCAQLAQESRELHDTLHQLAGFGQSFIGPAGPADVIVPDDSAEEVPA